MSNCRDTQKFKTSEASTKAAMRTQGAIDKFLNITNLNLFRQLNGRWSRDAQDRFDVNEMLFSEENNGTVAVPNKEAFKKIDTAKGILYQLEGAPEASASPEMIKKIKEVAEKMGVSFQELSDYAKATGLDTTGINALADLTRGIIAIAEGKEGVALTEEMVHIATAIMEQVNPKLVTQMIARIGQFQIYQDTLDQYKDNPNYQLPNGKPDIRKIKKEAVDKLLAEMIINGATNLDAFPELINDTTQTEVLSWWKTILNFIKSLYEKSNVDLFTEAKESILQGVGTVDQIKSEGVFYQITPVQKQITDKLIETDNAINKVYKKGSDDPVLMDSEEADNWYEKTLPGGEPKRIANRVTDRVKAWYEKKFRNKTFTEKEQEFNEFKKQMGIKGHKDLELIHDRYYNKDGTKKAKPDPRPDTSGMNLSSQEMYTKLETYYAGVVNSFPEGTLVFSEIMLYDAKKDEAGTIDFLAIEPSGKANILDWKFMDIKGDDVAWFKQGAFNIQLSRYKEMLRDQYGVKEFGMNRAIPIAFDIDYNENKKPYLSGIAIGSVDKSQITDLRLMPVSEETETTGYVELDKLLVKLNALLRQYEKQDVTDEEERAFKIERMNALRRAVRLIQGSTSIAELVDFIDIMSKEGNQILNDYNTIYKDRPATSKDSTNKELSDFAEQMKNYMDVADVFTNVAREIGHLIYSEDMAKGAKTDEQREELKERREILDNLRAQSDSIYRSKGQIKDAAAAFADKHIGQRNLVTGLLRPQAVIKGLTASFRSASDIGLKSVDVLYRLVRDAQNTASTDALGEIQRLMALREKLMARGGDIKKLIQQLYQKTEEGGLVNKLIYKYQKEFYDSVAENAKNGEQKKTWLLNNIDVEGYKAEANKILEERIKKINQNFYAGTEEEIADKKAYLIEEAKQYWDIDRKDFNGWDNYVISRHPAAKWISEEYKNIAKDEDLLALYNFISEFNKKAKDSGYITGRVMNTFLPFVRKGTAENLAEANILTVMKNFGDSLQIKLDDVGLGSFNEITGELENSIPRYYTRDFVRDSENPNDYSQVSEELFGNLILYIQQVNKYKYLSEVEGQIKLVRTIEELKGHLNTNRIGNVSDSTKPSESNTENLKIFDDFMRTILYGQKYALSDSDTPLHLNKVLGAAKNALNALLGKEVFKQNENPTATSLVKVMEALNTGFQQKALGLDLITGAIATFGANAQVVSQAGQYFKGKEFLANYGKVGSLKFNNNEEKDMFIQLLNTFMPMKDDPAYELYKDAGMSTFTRANIGDFLMIAMRKPEQQMEKAIFLSLLDNSMVVDGRIVNIRKYVTAKYKNRYASVEEAKNFKENVEKEIEELKKTQSIAVTKKLEDGKLVIPGLDLTDSKQVQPLTELARRITRKATGSLSNNDVNRMSMNIWTKSMMVFKNWIPDLADSHFSELRRTGDDFSVTINEDGIAEGEQYTIGRLRLLGYVLGTSIRDRSMNLINIMQMNAKGLEKLDEYYEDFARKYEERTGEPFTMDKNEFKDMIRQNIRSQMKELLLLASAFALLLTLRFMAPDDDEEDKATRNFHRYAEKVAGRFVSELSFFYDPSEFKNLLSGNLLPAVGLITDYTTFMSHFWSETTGIDIGSGLTYKEVKEKAKPIKYMMKMLPVTKAAFVYASIFSDEFAREFQSTIQAESNIR